MPLQCTPDERLRKLPDLWNRCSLKRPEDRAPGQEQAAPTAERQPITFSLPGREPPRINDP